MASSKLTKFLDRTSSPSHDYHTSTETFPAVNVERTSRTLELEVLGTSRGASEEPPSDFTGHDLVESKVVDHIEHLREQAENQFRDMMNSYRDRLFDLEFDTKVAQIRSAADVGVATLTGETQKGLDQLHGPREDMAFAERALAAYRAVHSLDRPAAYPRTK